MERLIFTRMFAGVVLLFALGGGDTTGPVPVVDLWLTEYVSDAYGESTVFITFGARSFPPRAYCVVP